MTEVIAFAASRSIGHYSAFSRYAKGTRTTSSLELHELADE